MNDTRDDPHTTPPRPVSTVAVPDAQALALRRRQSLNEQQRTYQSIPPSPYLFKKRPPG